MVQPEESRGPGVGSSSTTALWIRFPWAVLFIAVNSPVDGPVRIIVVIDPLSDYIVGKGTCICIPAVCAHVQVKHILKGTFGFPLSNRIGQVSSLGHALVHACFLGVSAAVRYVHLPFVVLIVVLARDFGCSLITFSDLEMSRAFDVGSGRGC